MIALSQLATITIIVKMVYAGNADISPRILHFITSYIGGLGSGCVASQGDASLPTHQSTNVCAYKLFKGYFETVLRDNLKPKYSPF